MPDGCSHRAKKPRVVFVTRGLGTLSLYLIDTLRSAQFDDVSLAAFVLPIHEQQAYLRG